MIRDYFQPLMSMLDDLAKAFDKQDTTSIVVLTMLFCAVSIFLISMIPLYAPLLLLGRCLVWSRRR